MHPRTLRNSLSYLLITGLAVFMFRGIFASGFMSGYDNSFHYYDVYYLANTLIPQYHWISGWNMQAMAGMPVLVDYYQTGFWLIVLLNKILFLPLNLSYKIIVLSSYMFLGAGFYKLASFRFGKAPALLMAACLMLQKDIYCDRILNGIWSNYLAIGIFLIFFHILDKDIERMTLRRAAILGIVLGLIILTHIYVAIFAFILFIIYSAPYALDAFRKRRFIRRFSVYSTIPILAVMVSSYYLYGFVAASGYFQRLGAEPLQKGLEWGVKSFFGPLETVNSVSAFMINVPVIMRILFSFFAIFVFFKSEKELGVRRFLISTLVFIFIALTLFSGLFTRLAFWRAIPFITTLQFARFLIYIQIGMYIFAAYGIAGFIARFGRRASVIGICWGLLAFSVFFHYSYIARDASKTLKQSPHMSEVFKVWDWVNENIRPGEERIIYENTVGNVDDPILRRSDVFALSGIFTKIPQIGVGRSASPFPQEGYMRNDNGLIFSEEIDRASDSFIAGRMRDFNAGYIVTSGRKLKDKLEMSGLFSKDRDFGIFSIFRLKDSSEGWIGFKDRAGYSVVAFEDQRVEFDIWNGSLDNEALIKIAYHPFWQAWLDGKPVKIEQAEFSTMKILLPEKNHYRLVLAFNSFNPVWVSVSLASLFGAILIIGYDIIRSRQWPRY